ncbi:hypothetical protein SK128_000292, partial [Halocaridina rubra]
VLIMSIIGISFAVMLLGSSMGTAQNSQGLSLIKNKKEDIPKETTMINIYPKDASRSNSKIGRSNGFCDAIETAEARRHCRDLLSRGIISQEFLAAFEGYDERRFRQSSPIRTAPSYINNGNAVHIEGGFHTSLPQHVYPPNPQGSVLQYENNPTVHQGIPVQQSPLVSFNLHSSPHFHESPVPDELRPVSNQPKQEETILPINTKLLVNTTDIPTIVQTLNQQTKTEFSDAGNSSNESMAQEPQVTSQKTQVPMPSIMKQNNQTSIHDPFLTKASTLPTTLSTSTNDLTRSTLPTAQNHSPSTTQNYGPSTTLSSTTMQEQSYITPDSATATQEPTTPSSFLNTTTEKINYHYLIHSSPLTESQSIALLKSQTSVNHVVKGAETADRGAETALPTQNNVNIKAPSGSTVSAHQHQIDMADILTNLQILTILMNPSHKEESSTQPSKGTAEQERKFSSSIYSPYLSQARSKSNIIRSLPNYANQYSFLTSPQIYSPLTSLMAQSNSNIHHRTSQINTTSESTNYIPEGNFNRQKINSQNVLNILQQADLLTYYSQLLGNSSRRPNTVSTVSTAAIQPIFNNPEQENTNIQKIFNNWHQNRNKNYLHTTQPKDISNYHEVPLASIIQSQPFEKTKYTPTRIDTNVPYIPALHSSSIEGFTTLEPLPPAPPLTSDTFVEDFSLPSIPFPVRSAGGGGSSYESIQQCLKNTACALFLAGIVATGTTAALAIPVLTPLFGAGFLGRRRKREIQYFILKPEDSAQFIDDYIHYANGIHIHGLPKETKCMYDIIKHPKKEHSKYVLGNLFTYLIQNKDKLLNITVHEIATHYNIPIPEPIVSIIKNNSKPDSVYLLNNTISQGSNTGVLRDANSSESIIKYNGNLEETTDKNTAHLHLPNINYKSNNARISPAEVGIIVNINNPSTQPQETDSSEVPSPQHINVLNENKYENIEEPGHEPGHLFDTPQLYPLDAFRPTPLPILYFSDDTAHDRLAALFHDSTMSSTGFLRYNNPQTEKIPTIQHSVQPSANIGESSMDNGSTDEPNILQAIHDNEGHRTDYMTLPLTSNTNSGTSQAFKVSPKFHLHQDHLHKIQDDVFNQVLIQKYGKVLNFYKILCQVLRDPRIPQSSITTFIAQRCLLFAHAGLIT